MTKPIISPNVAMHVAKHAFNETQANKPSLQSQQQFTIAINSSGKNFPVKSDLAVEQQLPAPASKHINTAEQQMHASLFNPVFSRLRALQKGQISEAKFKQELAGLSDKQVWNALVNLSKRKRVETVRSDINTIMAALPEERIERLGLFKHDMLLPHNNTGARINTAVTKLVSDFLAKPVLKALNELENGRIDTNTFRSRIAAMDDGRLLAGLGLLREQALENMDTEQSSKVSHQIQNMLDAMPDKVLHRLGIAGRSAEKLIEHGFSSSLLQIPIEKQLYRTLGGPVFALLRNRGRTDEAIFAERLAIISDSKIASALLQLDEQSKADIKTQRKEKALELIQVLTRALPAERRERLGVGADGNLDKLKAPNILSLVLQRIDTSDGQQVRVNNIHRPLGNLLDPWIIRLRGNFTHSGVRARAEISTESIDMYLSGFMDIAQGFWSRDSAKVQHGINTIKHAHGTKKAPILLPTGFRHFMFGDVSRFNTVKIPLVTNMKSKAILENSGLLRLNATPVPGIVDQAGLPFYVLNAALEGMTLRRLEGLPLAGQLLKRSGLPHVKFRYRIEQDGVTLPAGTLLPHKLVSDLNRAMGNPVFLFYYSQVERKPGSLAQEVRLRFRIRDKDLPFGIKDLIEAYVPHEKQRLTKTSVFNAVLPTDLGTFRADLMLRRKPLPEDPPLTADKLIPGARSGIMAPAVLLNGKITQVGVLNADGYLPVDIPPGPRPTQYAIIVQNKNAARTHIIQVPEALERILRGKEIQAGDRQTIFNWFDRRLDMQVPLSAGFPPAALRDIYALSGPDAEPMWQAGAHLSKQQNDLLQSILHAVAPLIPRSTAQISLEGSSQPDTNAYGISDINSGPDNSNQGLQNHLKNPGGPLDKGGHKAAFPNQQFFDPATLKPLGVTGNDGTQTGHSGSGNTANGSKTAVAASPQDGPGHAKIPEADSIIMMAPQIPVPWGFVIPEGLAGSTAALQTADTAHIPVADTSSETAQADSPQNGGVTWGGQLGSPAEAERARQEMDNLFGKGWSQGLRKDEFPKIDPDSLRVPGFGEGLEQPDLNSYNTGWGLPGVDIKIENESFPETDPVLDNILKPNGPAGPDFIFPRGTEREHLPEVPEGIRQTLIKAMPELQKMNYSQFNELSSEDQLQAVNRTLEYRQLTATDKSNISLIQYLDSRQTSPAQRQQLKRVSQQQLLHNSTMQANDAREVLSDKTLQLIKHRIQSLQANIYILNQQTDNLQKSNADRQAKPGKPAPVSVGSFSGSTFVKPEKPPITTGSKAGAQTVAVPRFMVINTAAGPKLMENRANGETHLLPYPIAADTPITGQQNGMWYNVPDPYAIGAKTLLDLFFLNSTVKMLNGGAPLPTPGGQLNTQPAVPQPAY